MRIALLTNEYPGVTPYTGGIGTHYAAIANGLAEREHQVFLAMPATAAMPPRHFGQQQIYPIWLPAVGRRSPMRAMQPWNSSKTFAQAAHLLARMDVVVAPEWGGWAYHLKRQRPDIRLVTNLATSCQQVRSIEPWAGGKQQIVADRIQQYTERHQARQSDAILAISQALIQWSQELWPEIANLPTRVIPNFIADSLIGLPSSGTPRRDVIFAGRLSQWKGADAVVAAMKLLWDRGSTLTLRMAGREDTILGAPAIASLKGIAGEHSDRISFLGPVPHDALMRLFQESLIAVFPSRFEGFGLAALEAMACGVAVVASRETGFDEFCQHDVNALLVDPLDPASIARAIETVQQDRTRHRLTQQASLTSRQFSASEIIPRLEDFLTSVAAAPIGGK